MNYICVSGGADSTAMALLLWERGEDFEMVFSDTGAELPETYWLLPRLVEKVGKKLNVCGNGGFFQHLVAHNWFLPGPRVRWCTKFLKMIPQDYFASQKKIEVMGVGIRADEPRRLERNPSYCHYERYFPLAEAGLNKKDIKSLCKKYDLLNPVYDWRTNVSCFCCFFQRKSDWKGLMKNHPTFFAIAEEWERQAKINPNHTWTQWNQSFSLEQFRKADKSQIEMWPEPDAEPCLICSI